MGKSLGIISSGEQIKIKWINKTMLFGLEKLRLQVADKLCFAFWLSWERRSEIKAKAVVRSFGWDHWAQDQKLWENNCYYSPFYRQESRDLESLSNLVWIKSLLDKLGGRRAERWHSLGKASKCISEASPNRYPVTKIIIGKMYWYYFIQEHCCMFCITGLI